MGAAIRASGGIGASGPIRTVSAAERRARLAVRHHLAPRARAGTVTDAVTDMIALHGTDPASVYLAARARADCAGQAAVEHALYTERSLVRMLGMRRTVFVIPAALVPVIQAACTDQIAERLRRQLTQVVQEAGIAPDAGSWLRDVGEAAVAVLAARGSATGAELAKAEPGHADHGRRGQSLRRGSEPDDQAAHVAVRRGAHRSRPPARGLEVDQFSWSVVQNRVVLDGGRRAD